MPRGIAWDELPLPHERYKPNRGRVHEAPKRDTEAEAEAVEERDLARDLDRIGRRAAFGLISGSLTGLCLGAVEILRDPKLMVAKRSVATSKLLRYSYLFGGFFATYHGYRKTLQVCMSLHGENNVMVAGVLSLAPLLAVPSWRFMLPYGAMLIGLDAINGMNDT